MADKYIVVTKGKIKLSDVVNDCSNLCVPASQGEPLPSILNKICKKISTHSGEITTALNIGDGEGIFKQKVGSELQFKSLVAGSDITITSTSNEITISYSGTVGEVNTASNIGTGEGIFSTKAGTDLQFKSLTAGTGIGLISTADEISITNLDPDQEVVLTAGTGIGITGTYPNFTIEATGVAAGARFGVAGEDDIAAEDRSFELPATFSWEIQRDSYDSYYGIYSSGSTLDISYFSQSAITGRQSGMDFYPGYYSTYIYGGNTINGGADIDMFASFIPQAILNAYNNVSGINMVSKVDLFASAIDATGYTELKREVIAGVGTNARFRADIDGAKVQAKSTIGGTYKGLIVKPNTDLIFENYPSTRNDASGITKALYITDASGNVGYGTIDTSGGFIIDGVYRFDNSTTAADPGSGDIRLNNATYGSVTEIYISQTSNGGTDAGNILGTLKSGDVIYLQDKNDATKWFRANLNVTPTDNGAWWTIPVTYVNSGGALFNNNQLLSVIVLLNSGSATSSGYTVHSITVANTPYTVTETSGKVIILADTSGGNIDINIPTAVGNTAEYTFKKLNDSSNFLTVIPNGVQTIDGDSSQVILDINDAFTIITDNTNWFVTSIKI